MDISEGRRYLKADDWAQWRDENHITDQKRGAPRPPAQKPCPEGAELVGLIPPEKFTVGNVPLLEVISKRRSRRSFTEETLTLEELSFLLWATQGVSKTVERPDGVVTFRTVPSGGCTHSFETYLAVRRVEGVPSALYRYLPLEHKLLLVKTDPDLESNVAEGCRNQPFVRQAAVAFIWTSIPYRTEWRYDIVAHKIIAQDSGHLCQNLYLAAESIGVGTCAIGAYNQEKIDEVVGVDGEDEFVVYVAPVGKVEHSVG